MNNSRCFQSLLGHLLLLFQSVTFADPYSNTRQLRAPPPSDQSTCEPEEGSFVIEASYQGEPGTFNIATTALGKDEDADEVYHLSDLQNDLASGITYQGCFESNTLHRFVVYIDRPGTFAPPPDGEFELTVNGNLIVSGTTQDTSTTFTEYYFSGDSEGCDGDLFSLIIQFDAWPSEIEWTLENRDDAIAEPLTHESTIKEGAQGYTSEFENALLFVDQCLTAGDEYRFSISDSNGDGLLSPNYYEIASNGVPFYKQVGNFGFASRFTFLPNGIRQPSSVPTPNQLPNPTGSPISIPCPTPKPASTKTPVSFPEKPESEVPSWCFSASTTVQVKYKGRTQMQFLEIGDEVQVGTGVYESVYSFGHYEPSGQAKFLLIETKQSKLEVSRQHLLFVEKGGTAVTVPSASILVGDRLVLGNNGGSTEVESIHPISVQGGLYAPFTPSGKLLVNGGLLVSSFVGFDETQQAGWPLGGGFEVSYHWLAHTFEFPHRIACYYLGRCPGETYNEDGLSSWVAWPMQSALSLINIESTALKGVLFGIFLSAMLIFSLLEVLVFHHGILALLGLMLLGKVKGGRS